MLKEDCASDLKVHLAQSLPLPSNVTRPRIDLIVFVVNLHSKYRSGASGFTVVRFVLPLFSVPAPAPPLPQPSECGGVPAPRGRRLLPGEGGLPRHGRRAGQSLQRAPEHRAEAGPGLPEPPALL
ncbi:centromere protein M [Phyllostomus discolor]|uniref:Centromere protein M n=1 Tax=Phyllostomus discolor TaxID=89673 RepID=A0A834AUK6_9CHIR|nr:centromere protein M [Phyllostomus discolor]